MEMKRCKCGCNEWLTTPNKWGRHKRFINGHASRGKNNGMYGYCPTLEERKRQSICMSGKNNPFYGKKHNAKTRKKIGEMVSKSMTLEHRKQISKIMTGKSQPKGKDSHGWRGGKPKTQMGYILIHCPSHPHNYNGYVKEHRLIMEKHIGRYLTPKEVVHHINGVKSDNRLSNLWLYKKQGEHSKHHYNLRKAKIEVLEKSLEVALRNGSYFEIFSTKGTEYKGMPPIWTPEEMGYCIDELTGEVLCAPEEALEKNGVVENAKKEEASAGEA